MVVNFSFNQYRCGEMRTENVKIIVGKLEIWIQKFIIADSL